MKKYITILGLLLAGSLLANADITTTFNRNGSSEITSTTLDVTGINGITGRVDSLKSSPSSSSSLQLINLQGDISQDPTFFGPNVESNQEWVTYFKYTSSTKTVSVSEIKFNVKLFDKNSGNFVNGDGSTFEFKVFLGGKFASSTYSANSSDGEVFLQLDQPATLTAGRETTLQITATRTSGSHNIGLSSITFHSPVPEPSAFGLLAGIGALALVASRRRRK